MLAFLIWSIVFYRAQWQDEKKRPQSYIPQHLTDKILATRSSIEGERKLLTVLFADVKGSTSIGETLDPEELRSIIEKSKARHTTRARKGKEGTKRFRVIAIIKPKYHAFNRFNNQANTE